MYDLSKMLATSAQNPSLAGFALIFVGGLATSLSPCILPVLPLVIGYMGGYSRLDKRRTFIMGLFLIAGLSVTLVAFGLATSFMGIIFGRIGKIWYWAVGLVLIAMGLHLLSLIKINIPGFNVRIPRIDSLPGAFLAGLLFGLVTSSCGTPILIGVLSYVSLCKSYSVGALALFVYGLGRGIILLLLGSFAGFARSVKYLEPYGELISKLSGFLLVVMGIYIIYQTL